MISVTTRMKRVGKLAVVSGAEKRKFLPRYNADTMSTWVRRGEASKLAGISRAALIKREGVDLFPAVDSLGYYWFDPAELEEFRARRSLKQNRPTTRGDVEREVFLLFRQSWRLPDIVIATRKTSAFVRYLYRQFVTPLGDELPEDVVEKAKAEEDAHYKVLEEMDRQFGRRRGGRPLGSKNKKRVKPESD